MNAVNYGLTCYILGAVVFNLAQLYGSGVAIVAGVAAWLIIILLSFSVKTP